MRIPFKPFKLVYTRRGRKVIGQQGNSANENKDDVDESVMGG